MRASRGDFRLGGNGEPVSVLYEILSSNECVGSKFFFLFSWMYCAGTNTTQVGVTLHQFAVKEGAWGHGSGAC